MSKWFESTLYSTRLRVMRSVSRRLGKDWFMGSLDRIFLEDNLFRIFKVEGFSVLSIGCHPASGIYRKLLPADRYHTLDIDPDNARYGARNHTIGDCRDLSVLLPGRKFDIILFNGILGYGIDESETFHSFQASAHTALCDGGWLVVGYNDIPSRKAGLIRSIDSTLFSPSAFLDSIPSKVELPTHNRHTFEFFRKAGA